LALALLFTCLPLSFSFDSGCLRFFMLRDVPLISSMSLASALGLWIAFIRCNAPVACHRTLSPFEIAYCSDGATGSVGTGVFVTTGAGCVFPQCTPHPVTFAASIAPFTAVTIFTRAVPFSDT
jgi:hypothetical protein